jgi:hypothetical protein
LWICGFETFLLGDLLASAALAKITFIPDDTSRAQLLGFGVCYTTTLSDMGASRFNAIAVSVGLDQPSRFQCTEPFLESGVAAAGFTGMPAQRVRGDGR